MDNIKCIKLSDEIIKSYPGLLSKQKEFKEVFLLKESDGFHKKGDIIAGLRIDDNNLVCYPEYEHMFEDEYNIPKPWWS